MRLFYAFSLRWFIYNAQRAALCSWTRRGCLQLASVVLLASLLLASCSNSNGGAIPTVQITSTAAPIAVAKLHWCGKPLLLFRDEGASTAGQTGAINQAPTGDQTATPTSTTNAGSQTPTTTPTSTASSPRTINDWKQVESNLDFRVYLPSTLPENTCLMSASGTIHDPILGGSFTIGYLLPDHSAISLSEAPLRSQSPSFQCSPAPASASSSSAVTSGTPVATQSAAQSLVQVCNGARGTTNIVFAVRGKTDELRKFFDALQSGVDWIPTS